MGILAKDNLRSCSIPGSGLVVQPPKVRRLLASYLVLSLVFCLGIQLYGPFLRSLVVCNVAVEHGQGFSGSAHCGDFRHVLSAAQAEEGRLVGIKLLLHGWSGPILAGFADSWGRRPVLLWGLSGFSCAFCLLALVASFPELHHATSLVVTCFVIEGVTSAFDVVYLAILSDLQQNPTERASAFSAYFAIGALGDVGAQLVASKILRQQLTSYDVVWSCMAFVLIVNTSLVWMFVEESLPPNAVGESVEDPAKLRSLQSTRQLLAAPMKLVRDPFLQRWELALMLTSLANGFSTIEASFTIAVYGWQPGDLQAYTWPARAISLGSVVLMGTLASSYSPLAVLTPVTVLQCLLIAVRMFAPFTPVALIGPTLLTSSLAFAAPVTTAFVSSRFTAAHQAKVHAVSHLCTNLSSSLAITAASSSLVFQPEAREWAASVPFICAAGLSSVGGMLRLHILRDAHRSKSFELSV